MTPPRKATMADVARLAGVSPMTVSRAFKADSSVSDATRQAILQAADDLGYVFDSTASSLRSQKSDFVAVTIPSINNANFAETVRGLSEGLKARGLQILLGSTDYDTAEEERLIEQFLRRRPEAIVVTGGKHTPRARRLLEAAGIPSAMSSASPTPPPSGAWSITSSRKAWPGSPSSEATPTATPAAPTAAPGSSLRCRPTALTQHG